MTLPQKNIGANLREIESILKGQSGKPLGKALEGLAEVVGNPEMRSMTELERSKIGALLERIESDFKGNPAIEAKSRQIAAVIKGKSDPQVVKDLAQESEESKASDKVLQIEREGVGSDIVSIGDLHGNSKALWHNLVQAGVVNSAKEWIAGKRKVVFHGDILADRNMEGFKILEEMGMLRKKAEASGGEVIVLAGNHDDFMIAFLMNRKIRGGDPFKQCYIGGQQGLGLLELTQFTGDGKPLTDFFSGDVKERLKGALEAMRKSEKGRQLLEEICKMKLAERIDDTLLIHTDPTNEILEAVEKHGVETINKRFQEALRGVLLGGDQYKGQVDGLMDAFLYTENRTFSRARGSKKTDLRPDLIDRLKEKGIRWIVFGHSDEKLDSEKKGLESRKAEIHGMNFVGVDQGVGKNGGEMVAVSAAILKVKSPPPKPASLPTEPIKSQDPEIEERKKAIQKIKDAFVGTGEEPKDLKNPSQLLAWFKSTGLTEDQVGTLGIDLDFLLKRKKEVERPKVEPPIQKETEVQKPSASSANHEETPEELRIETFYKNLESVTAMGWEEIRDTLVIKRLLKKDENADPKAKAIKKRLEEIMPQLRMIGKNDQIPDIIRIQNFKKLLGEKGLDVLTVYCEEGTIGDLRKLIEAKRAATQKSESPKPAHEEQKPQSAKIPPVTKVPSQAQAVSDKAEVKSVREIPESFFGQLDAWATPEKKLRLRWIYSLFDPKIDQLHQRFQRLRSEAEKWLINTYIGSEKGPKAIDWAQLEKIVNS